MNQPHAVYHWWSFRQEPEPYCNLRTPILLSIATLRAVSNMPITVLDSSEVERNWAHFPEKLGFTVERTTLRLESVKDRVEGWCHLSRIFDVQQWAQQKCPSNTVMYVDSDVFWFNDPLPLACDPQKFCWNGFNSGFFYYNQSPNNELFHDIFAHYTYAAIYSQHIRSILKNYVGYDAWYGVWDEMVLRYMMNEHPELFEKIPVEEHTTTKMLRYCDRSKIKMFHGNGTMVANEAAKRKGEREHSRGLLALIIKEFYENAMKVLDEKDLAMIFTEKEKRLYLPQQFSLLDDLDRLLATKDDTGHYHIWKCLRLPNMVIP